MYIKPLPSNAIDKEFEEVSDEMLGAIISVNNPLDADGTMIEKFINAGMIKVDENGEVIPFHLISKEIAQLSTPKKSLYPIFE